MRSHIASCATPESSKYEAMTTYSRSQGTNLAPGLTRLAHAVETVKFVTR